jgi:hypothetical protein
MSNLLLHVTDLDSWRWYNIIESMPVHEMVGRLLRTDPANEHMLMGTAWHAILEDPPEQIDTIERDGFTFTVACDASIVLPDIKEVRAAKDYSIDGINVRLTGKCDGATGNVIYDHKLTFNPDPENYLEAYQWRAYLDIFNADAFEYLIYHGIEDGKRVVIRDVSSLVVYRYPGMVEDLKDGLRQLVSFIKQHVPQMIV